MSSSTQVFSIRAFSTPTLPTQALPMRALAIQTSMMQALDLEQGLSNYHGTDTFYRYTKDLIYTDGIHFLVENAGAYWLLDLIASYQSNRAVAKEKFQVYQLTKLDDDSALVEVSDGNENIKASQDIPFTDFPLSKITLWCVDGTILLPSEY